MYLPALPNCVSMFQNSTGGSSTISLTLHDCFPGRLIFNVQTMSIALKTDNSVPRSPFEVPFSWLLVFEIDSVAYVKGWWFSIHGLLCSSEAVFI